MRNAIDVSTGYVPRPWQLKVHESLKRFSVLVVHRRGGKTVLATNALIDAALAIQRPDARFGYIAPFLKQARLIAWDYLKRFTRPIPRVEYNESALSILFPNGARIQLFGSDNPDALRGIYFDGVVLDEVAQMRPEIWGEIVRPQLADRKGWVLFLGTPKGTNLFSELYHAAIQDPAWYADLLTVDDTSALDDQEVELAKRTMTPEQIRQEFYCDFTAGATDALLPLSECLEAAKRAPKPEAYAWAARVMGVDVARYGNDRTAVARRQGRVLFPVDTFRGLSTMEVASQVARIATEWKPQQIFVDVGGIGAGVYDRLQQLGYPVLPVEFGGKAANPRFENKRAEMWWEAAQWIRDGGAIPNDQALFSDLSAQTYDFANARGRFALTTKDEMREQGLPSPDVGDAFALTFAFPVAAPEIQAGLAGRANIGRVQTDYDPMG